jgi:hypothetical protein
MYQITFPGYIWLPLGLIVFFVSSTSLLYITIFFANFSVTSLINSPNGAPFVIYYYFGILLFIRVFLISLINGNLNIKILFTNKNLNNLMLWQFIIVISLITPYLVNGNFIVDNMKLDNIESYPITLTIQSIKNLFPTIFGINLIFLIYLISNNMSKLIALIKIYILSILFISIYGICEYICNILDIYFPYFIFNSIENGTSQIIGTTISDGKYLRISSLALEPSVLAQIILSALPYPILSLFFKKYIFNFILDSLILLIFLTTLFITTSSTAIIGLFLLFFILNYVIRKVDFKKSSPKYLIYISSFLLLTYLFFGNYLINLILEKINSFSYSERLYSITHAFNYFLEFPILGLGWTSVTSHDLFVLILSNSGLIGFFVFFRLIYMAINESLKNIKLLNKNLKYYSNSYSVILITLISSFLILILVFCFTEFTYYLLNFYISFAFLITFNHLIYKGITLREAPI